MEAVEMLSMLFLLLIIAGLGTLILLVIAAFIVALIKDMIEVFRGY